MRIRGALLGLAFFTAIPIVHAGWRFSIGSGVAVNQLLDGTGVQVRGWDGPVRAPILGFSPTIVVAAEDLPVPLDISFERVTPPVHPARAAGRDRNRELPTGGQIEALGQLLDGSGISISSGDERLLLGIDPSPGSDVGLQIEGLGYNAQAVRLGGLILDGSGFSTLRVDVSVTEAGTTIRLSASAIDGTPVRLDSAALVGFTPPVGSKVTIEYLAVPL